MHLLRIADLYGQSLPDLIVCPAEPLKTTTTILHSEGGDCKSLFVRPDHPPRESAQDRVSGLSPVGQLERKEKNRLSTDLVRFIQRPNLK